MPIAWRYFSTVWYSTALHNITFETLHPDILECFMIFVCLIRRHHRDIHLDRRWHKWMWSWWLDSKSQLLDDLKKSFTINWIQQWPLNNETLSSLWKERTGWTRREEKWKPSGWVLASCPLHPDILALFDIWLHYTMSPLRPCISIFEHCLVIFGCVTSHHHQDIQKRTSGCLVIMTGLWSLWLEIETRLLHDLKKSLTVNWQQHWPLNDEMYKLDSKNRLLDALKKSFTANWREVAGHEEKKSGNHQAECLHHAPCIPIVKYFLVFDCITRRHLWDFASRYFSIVLLYSSALHTSTAETHSLAEDDRWTPCDDRWTPFDDRWTPCGDR